MKAQLIFWIFWIASTLSLSTMIIAPSLYVVVVGSIVFIGSFVFLIKMWKK